MLYKIILYIYFGATCLYQFIKIDYFLYKIFIQKTKIIVRNNSLLSTKTALITHIVSFLLYVFLIFVVYKI